MAVTLILPTVLYHLGEDTVPCEPVLWNQDSFKRTLTPLRKLKASVDCQEPD